MLITKTNTQTVFQTESIHKDTGYRLLNQFVSN
jgi:hypothetical protein